MMRVLPLMALLASASPAQAQTQAPSCPFPGQVPVLVVQVFFGGSVPSGTGSGQRGDTLVSHRAWARFVADTIVPALPDGFTLTEAAGHYRDPATGATRPEPTEVLLVAAPDGPAFRDRVAAIADAYRRRFAQRAVGVVSTPGCAGF